MSALRTRCHRSVGTELSLVDVGAMEDLLDQISKLQHQVSSLQQELKRLSEERRLSGAGLDAQKQQALHDCVGAPRACGVGETEQPSASTPECVCEGDELQEGVSEGEEAEPLQDGDEHTLNTLSKVCSVKLMDCRMAPTLNTHITREEAEDTGQDDFDMSSLDKWLKRSISHGKRSSTCSECGKTFSRPSTLRAHMRKHTGETLPHCACGKTFSYTSSLIRHQKECCSLFCDSQNERKVPPEEQRQYQCSFCGKQFSTKGHVTIHERLHTGKKPYECSECKQAFVRVDRLKEHQRVHTGEKPYECSYCGKPFALLGGLKTHHRTHTGEKPYKCNVCKKRFTQSTKLKIHLRTHTGERPYRCSECGKAFARTEHLRTHQKIHSAGKRQGGALRGGRVVSVAYSTKPQTTE